MKALDSKSVESAITFSKPLIHELQILAELKIFLEAK